MAIFMASPTLQTLPVKIWATLRQDLTPVIAAASTLLVVFTLALMIVAALVAQRTETMTEPFLAIRGSARNTAPSPPCRTSRSTSPRASS